MGDFWAKLAATLSGIVSVGFLAWAGLVWTAVENVNALVTRLATVQVTVNEINANIERIETLIQLHEGRPWHEQAGNSLNTLQLRVDALRRDIERMER